MSFEKDKANTEDIYIYMLWYVPLLRFIIPVGIVGKFSFMSLLSKHIVKFIPFTNEHNLLHLTASNYIKQADSYFPTTIKNEFYEDTFELFFCVWILGVLCLAGFMFISYKEGQKELRDTVCKYRCFYKVHNKRKAAVYGIIHPIIVVPDHLSQKDLKYILMHEMVHLKRGDNLYRMIAWFITCIHWFNPMAWLFLKRCYEDIEISCDERVLRKLNEAEQKEYAYTLLNSVQVTGGNSSAFGGSNIRNRIGAIVNYRNMTLFSSILFGIMSIILFLLLLGNAQGRGII